MELKSVDDRQKTSSFHVLNESLSGERLNGSMNDQKDCHRYNLTEFQQGFKTGR